jgi:type II secretory pathway pseudopilin PulG
MHSPTRSASAFTLVEMMVTAAVVAIFGGLIMTLLTMGMTLYTQNVSISQTHAGGLNTVEQLLLKVAAAAEVPVLVDDAGAPLAGSGPAAGVRFYSLASSQAYPVPAAANATDTSFTITQAGSRPAPQIGDKITMADLGFAGVITSVAASGSNYAVGFASTVGSGFTPVKTTGVAIPASSKCFLLQPTAFISVSGGLRYYPRAMSVAGDGASAFGNKANFQTIATLLPQNSDTNCFPFQYLDPARRSVDVNLRVRAAAYGSRISNFYTFQSMKTTVAYRSAVTN